jgi:hypothetical protein
MREKNGIDGGMAGDCAVACCCAYCSICQELHQSKKMKVILMGNAPAPGKMG